MIYKKIKTNLCQAGCDVQTYFQTIFIITNLMLTFSFRMANARAKAEQADLASNQARKDSDIARVKAKDYAPEFHQPGKS